MSRMRNNTISSFLSCKKLYCSSLPCFATPSILNHAADLLFTTNFVVTVIVTTNLVRCYKKVGTKIYLPLPLHVCKYWQIGKGFFFECIFSLFLKKNINLGLCLCQPSGLGPFNSRLGLQGRFSTVFFFIFYSIYSISSRFFKGS